MARTSGEPKGGVAGIESTGERAGLAKRSVQLSAPEAARLIRDAIAAGGEMWVSGSGQSMHPTVHHADQVLVAPLGREVRRRDVVLVPLGPRLMLHRVVEVRPKVILTRGDGRLANDPPVQREEVVARAVAVRRDGTVRPLVPTTRFGATGLIRFLIWEMRRPVRRARALLRNRLRKQKRDA